MVCEGVRDVFCNLGASELPLTDLFAARVEIKYILALHEDSTSGSYPVTCPASDTTDGSADETV